MARTPAKRPAREASVEGLPVAPAILAVPTGVALPLQCQLAAEIGCLPKDMAVMLISLGLVGVAIPGPIPPGASFILLGTVILWPNVLVRTGGPLAHRFPRVFRMLVHFASDLHRDLDRRYPDSQRA